MSAPAKQAKTTACATASSSSFSSSFSPDKGMWVMAGQAVCVVNPRIMLTATHVCFDRSAQCSIRILYTPLDGSAPQSFSASLIRYSGLMDVSILLLDTQSSSSPFRPANIVPANSQLFDRRGESVALACFPLVADLNAQPGGAEKVMVNKASALVKMSRILPGSISGTTPQTTSHKGITRSFQTADCTYPSFAGCSGGGVFSLHLSADGVTPQLLGVHTSAIFQTGQSQLQIASVVEGEYDGAEAAAKITANVDAAASAAATNAHAGDEETGDDGRAGSSSTAIAAKSRSKSSRKRKASASIPSSSSAITDVAFSPSKGASTGSTTPEDTPTKALQLKLADEVQHKSALAVCVVAEAVFTQHAAWNEAALNAEAARTLPSPVSSSAPTASTDIHVGIARMEEEKRHQQSSSPHFIMAAADQHCLYD
jgi:WAS/WASL-interacting protein